ncbi:PilZ domain-containing protein [Novosphingobium sp. BW1]|uniref:PilZ domain-containing protein n=1 Tax=Novosphingobium sp. BW1 TaxID=2592621 RepID=UPI001396A043|nr:PilZ domain-containing protein [Novosphingobium sp. BW1]
MARVTRAPRHRTLMRAVMMLPGLDGTPVMIRNVSEQGLCLASKDVLPCCGEVIELDLAGTFGLKGEVRWVEGREFGVQLSAPLDLHRIGLANQRRNGNMAGTLGGQVETRLLRATPKAASAPLYAC